MGQSFYRTLIGNDTQSIERCHFQRLWVTSKRSTRFVSISWVSSCCCCCYYYLCKHVLCKTCRMVLSVQYVALRCWVYLFVYLAFSCGHAPSRQTCLPPLESNLCQYDRARRPLSRCALFPDPITSRGPVTWSMTSLVFRLQTIPLAALYWTQVLECAARSSRSRPTIMRELYSPLLLLCMSPFRRQAILRRNTLVVQPNLYIHSANLDQYGIYTTLYSSRSNL